MDLDIKRIGKRKIMLALQGGGAHTAYVWGVVDRLLESDDIEIVGVSGTSGGAMIATVLAYGLSLERDADGKLLNDAQRRSLTRNLLDKFWRDVSAIGDLYWNPYRFIANPLHPSWNIDGLPAPIMFNALSLLISPYQSWARKNPVVMAIADSIDLDALRRSKIGPALYVCATNVRTNQPRIFTRDELQLEHLLASACLPVVDRAVRAGTEYYWDGGYVADPALAPLIENHSTVTSDLVIAGVNPLVMDESAVPPDTAWKIIDRMNQITFNASLISEIKRIYSANELLAQVPDSAPARQQGGKLYGKKQIFIHYIPPHADMASFGVASKNNTALPFLQLLKSLGSAIAQQWITGKTEGGGAALLGISSDTNLERLFIDTQHWDAAALPHASPAAPGSTVAEQVPG